MFCPEFSFLVYDTHIVMALDILLSLTWHCLFFHSLGELLELAHVARSECLVFKSVGTFDLYFHLQMFHWCLTLWQGFNLLCHTSPDQSNSSSTGKRIRLLYGAQYKFVFVTARERKQHIWHEYKQLFPPGECYSQVSWRQFKCNGASKLIFPKII